MKKIFFAFSSCLFVHALCGQELRYTACNECWNADSLGNHRVLVQVNGTGTVARVVIPWRRRDRNPQDKRIIVEDANTHQKISNVKTASIKNESGEIYFEPSSGKGDYYVYYMPYRAEGRSNYPKGVYPKPEAAAADG